LKRTVPSISLVHPLSGATYGNPLPHHAKHINHTYPTRSFYSLWDLIFYDAFHGVLLCVPAPESNLLITWA